MEPPPSKPWVTSTPILIAGTFIYLLARLWLPSLLILTLILSKFIPHFFRLNDHGDTRRRLWKSWSMDEERPDEWKPESIDKNMILKESYWMNQRLVGKKCCLFSISFGGSN